MDEGRKDSQAGAEPRVRAIAYYLPQYHPIPENDEWWGKGFTEWASVARARPLYPGHYQPHVPSELGFYDLRLPETRVAQAELARAYGIHGFCYYYYSFGEKRLLERPLLEMVESGKPDFPFCLCWANETWSRRWDGAEAQVLVAQDDSPETYKRFIHEVMPILLDRRYIRVSGSPLLLVYRVGRIPDPAGIARYWREAAVQAGLPGLYLCAVQSHDPQLDPRARGFDAAVEFPPSPWSATLLPRPAGLDADFTGCIYDYRDAASRALTRPRPDYRLLRGVMTSWDNTARRGPASYLFEGSSPREYEAWLRGAVSWTEIHNPPEERLVFLNAWNEWAEGAHLEPDHRHGRAWLEATARGLARGTAWRRAIEELRRGDLPAEERLSHLRDIEFALENMDRTAAGEQPDESRLELGTPSAMRDKPLAPGGAMKVDRLQGSAPSGFVSLRPGEPLEVRGWAFAPGVELARTPSFVALRSPTGDRIYSALIARRRERHDVAFRNRGLEPRFTALSGFDVRLRTDTLTPGEYKLLVLHCAAQQVVASTSEHRVVVE